MINILEICKEPGTLKVILFIKYLINFVFIVIPIGLIIMSTIDIFKSIVSGKEDGDKKNLSTVFKRIISGILLFLVPTLINIVFDVLVEAEVKYATCWKEATATNIKNLEISNAEEKLAAAKNEITIESIQAAETAINQVSDNAKREEYQKEIDDLKKEIQKKAEEAKAAEKSGKKNATSKDKPKEDTNTTSTTTATTNTNTASYNGGGTQAASFNELGDRANKGNQEARNEWIEKVAKIVQNAQHAKYGMKNSLIIAQIINESGWMKPPPITNDDGTTLVNSCNNILGVNYDMGKPFSTQSSAWSKNPQKCANSNVTQKNKSTGEVYRTKEDMRKYNSIEECIEDYASLIFVYHPECKNNNNIECYRSFLHGYTPPADGEPDTADKYKKIISDHNLERFDQ